MQNTLLGTESGAGDLTMMNGITPEKKLIPSV